MPVEGGLCTLATVNFTSPQMGTWSFKWGMDEKEHECNEAASLLRHYWAAYRGQSFQAQMTVHALQGKDFVPLPFPERKEGLCCDVPSHTQTLQHSHSVSQQSIRGSLRGSTQSKMFGVQTPLDCEHYFRAVKSLRFLYFCHKLQFAFCVAREGVRPPDVSAKLPLYRTCSSTCSDYKL
eukprot:1162026-Pelagomonas_calceolata.AAC.5